MLFLIKFGVKSAKFKKDSKCKKISRAVKADLAAITRIYNASVLERNATAALHPVGIEEREAWFDVHEAANRPIYVLREVCEEFDERRRRNL